MEQSFINYAHRGASHYAPENTMLAFYLGIWMGANGIETDVQLTADGVPVLFHDDALLRVTGQPGHVRDYDLKQLQQFRVEKGKHHDRIPTLEDFLEHFAHRELTFAIELKQPDSAPAVAELIRRYGVQDKTVVTSFDYDAILSMRRLAPEQRTGYLTGLVDDALLAKMRADGIYQLCPKADMLTKNNVSRWHDAGFSVRAWGVSDEQRMRHAYDCGVDGMTVNFPDKLKEYIKENADV